MRNGTKPILLILFTLGFSAWLLITGISDLTNQKDLHTVHIDVCTQILKVKKTLSFIIPTGTDYYYLAGDYGTETVCLIKAPESWYKQHFNAEHEAYQTGGINITALAKPVTRSNVRRELEYRINDLNSQIQVDYSVSPQRVLVLEYKRFAIEKLALLASGIAFAASVYIAYKQDRVSSSIPVKVLGLVFVVLMFVVLL